MKERVPCRFVWKDADERRGGDYYEISGDGIQL